jgi:hypothetical protein
MLVIAPRRLRHLIGLGLLARVLVVSVLRLHDALVPGG